MEARQPAHTSIYVDKAGFNLAKTRSRGRNVIGQRVEVPGQRGANITMWLDREQPWMSQAREELTSQCVQHCPMMVFCYTNYSLASTIQRGSVIFLITCIINLCQQRREGLETPLHSLLCGIMWNSTTLLQSDWFAAHPRTSVLFLPPYTTFLNHREEFFSVWRWKVYDHHPHDQMSLLESMNAACGVTSPEDCLGVESLLL